MTMRPIASRPIATAPKANAPSASAPIAMAPTAAAPVARAGTTAAEDATFAPGNRDTAEAGAAGVTTGDAMFVCSCGRTGAVRAPSLRLPPRAVTTRGVEVPSPFSRPAPPRPIADRSRTAEPAQALQRDRAAEGEVPARQLTARRD